MPIYKKIHIYVEAVFFNGYNVHQVTEFSKGELKVRLSFDGDLVLVDSNGNRVGKQGEYIIREGYKHYYSLSEDEFHAIYERA